MFKKGFIFLLLLAIVFANLNASQVSNIIDLENKALVIVPVADATTESVAKIDSKRSAESIYSNIAISPQTGPYSCVRAYQLLFNEVVTILQETDQEVEVAVDNNFYDREKKENGKSEIEKVNRFWTLKRNVRRLIDFRENIESIPCTYGNFNNLEIYVSNNVISLKRPWQDLNNKIIYSAGTRFVLCSNQTNEEAYEAKILNPNTNVVDKVFIDKSCACLSEKLNNAQKLNNFLSLLNDWSNLKTDSAIPYVWGGRSFISTCDPKTFNLIVDSENAKLSYWVRPIERQPYTGMDCSGLIYRAAQICGLPYFYENTSTLANRLRSLNTLEDIREGDLIFFPGHVMIVSNVKCNQFIHSSGYENHYACLKTSCLESLFENIRTYTELKQAYVNQNSLSLINVRGQRIIDSRTNMPKEVKIKILRIVEV